MIQYFAEHNTCRLSGDFLFSNAMDCLQTFESFKGLLHTSVTLDCAKITKADSSFLAILIEIRCWAHKKRWPFVIKDLPIFLKNFLSVYGIEELLTTPIIDADFIESV